MHARTLSLVLLLACGGRADRRDRVAADGGTDPGGTALETPAGRRPPEVALLLGSARIGEPLAPGWTVVDAGARPGSITVTLQADDGRRVLVEAFRRDVVAQAPVMDANLELYVMDGTNSGLGTTPTDCALVDALQVMLDGALDPGAHARLAERLLTRSERRARYPQLDLPEGPTPPPLPPEIGMAVSAGAPMPPPAPGPAPMPLEGPRLVDVPITPFPSAPPPASIGPFAPGTPGASGMPGVAAAPVPSLPAGPTVPAEAQITSGPSTGKTPDVTTTQVPPPPSGWATAPAPAAPTTGTATVPPAPAPTGVPVPPAPGAPAPGVATTPVPPAPPAPATTPPQQPAPAQPGHPG